MQNEFNEKVVAVAEKAIQHWGVENQRMKFIEECGEATQAMIKQMQYPSEKHFDHLCEELADVYITLCQMAIYCADPYEVKQWIDRKTTALNERIEKDRKQ